MTLKTMYVYIVLYFDAGIPPQLLRFMPIQIQHEIHQQRTVNTNHNTLSSAVSTPTHGYGSSNPSSRNSPNIHGSIR